MGPWGLLAWNVCILLSGRRAVLGSLLASRLGDIVGLVGVVSGDFWGLGKRPQSI